MFSYFHLYFLSALIPRFLQLLCSPSGSCMLKDPCIIRAFWPSDCETLSSEEGNWKVNFGTFCSIGSVGRFPFTFGCVLVAPWWCKKERNKYDKYIGTVS